MMPTKAATPCKNRLCSGFVKGGICNKCGPVRNTSRKSNWGDDKERGTAHQRGYGANWRNLRLMVLAEMPLCNECMKRGRVVSAVTVDHIIPKSQGGDDDFSNLQSLCKECHATKTAKEGYVASRKLDDSGNEA